MRPLKLVMTGFESYKDRTEINFEKLGNRGLYLITGDTGAGKTTIFDAITFALYGSSSGADRNVEMLRSHFADENTPTKVELDFEANGKKYNIIRNPEYERKALRGEGLTTEAANAELRIEGQPPVTGLSKVNLEIEKILNLKKEQFCSIAMIAQGRFQQLLLSKKEEKERLFRELFHTEKYEKLQNQLKTDKGNAEKAVGELKVRLGEALSAIEVNEKDSEAEEINKIKSGRYVTEEELKVLSTFIAKDEKLLSEILKKISDTEKKLDKVNEELQSGQVRAKLEEQYTLAEKGLSEKIDALVGLTETVLKTEKDAEKNPELEKEKTLLEASLKDYEEIFKTEMELKTLDAGIVSDEKELSNLELKKTEIEKELAKTKAEQIELKNAGQLAGTYEAALEKIEDEKNELSDIEKRIKGLREINKELVLAQEKVADANYAFEAANKIYSEKLRLFNLEQAGILAEGLQEGCPCPVCGSTEHPHPAVKSSEAPTQEELERAKDKADALSTSSSKLAVEAGQKKTEKEKAEEEINRLLKKHFESLTVYEENCEAELENRKVILTDEAAEKQAALIKENKDKARREEIEKTLPEYEKKLEAVKNNSSQLVSRISAAKAKLETERKNLNEKKGNLKYETLEEAKKHFSLLASQIEQIKNAEKLAHENKTNCEKEIEKLKGERDSLKSQLEKTKPVDMDSLYNEKNKLLNVKDELNNQRDALNERKGLNQESVRKIIELVPEIDKATERYNMISALSEVAAGSSRGKSGKPSLETFVQMHCLDQINRRANLRLKKMTDNKYELRRRVEENGAELGLDLNVKDFYTGRERNVQSLSGGEQFQASLALALGLADEIQDNAGGIKLDAMFIDEGFGTLDSETLNKAMRALEDLSQGDKIVGIISHVEELESRIPKKICVKKDETGISHASLSLEI